MVWYVILYDMWHYALFKARVNTRQNMSHGWEDRTQKLISVWPTTTLNNVQNLKLMHIYLRMILWSNASQTQLISKSWIFAVSFTIQKVCILSLHIFIHFGNTAWKSCDCSQSFKAQHWEESDLELSVLKARNTFLGWRVDPGGCGTVNVTESLATDFQSSHENMIIPYLTALCFQ